MKFIKGNDCRSLCSLSLGRESNEVKPRSLSVSIAVFPQVLPGFWLRSCPTTTWSWSETAWRNWGSNASACGLSLWSWMIPACCGTSTASTSSPGESLPSAARAVSPIQQGQQHRSSQHLQLRLICSIRQRVKDQTAGKAGQLELLGVDSKYS